MPGAVTILDSVSRKGLIEKLVFESRPKGGKGVSHVNI
jgi:hypothetical protein